MNKNEVIPIIVKYTKKLPKNGIPMNPLAVQNCLAEVVSAFRENNVVKRDIAEIDAKKEVLLKDVEERYSFYRYVFENVFSERRMAIDKYFEIIDKGIAEDNENLVLAGLQNLSKVVSSSPIGDALALQTQIATKGYLDLDNL